MRVLVTGANSFVGRHAAVALSKAGLRVIATYRSDDSRLEDLRRRLAGAEFLKLDLGSAAGFDVLPSSIDAILHVAGVSVTSTTTVGSMLDCNVAGTRHLIDYAQRANVKRIIYTSAVSVYGDVCEAVIDENTPIRAPDVYGASKYLAERMFQSASALVPCVAVRLPGVLGLGAHRAWIPSLLERLRRNEEVTIYNPEAGFNNAVHIEDLCKLFLNLLVNPWGGYHAFPVGASGVMPIADVVKTLRDSARSQSSIKIQASKKNAFVISSRSATEVFGYRPLEIGDMLRRYVGED